MKTLEGDAVRQAEKKDVQKFIDLYLTEEDKSRILSKTTKNDVRLFPGNELFHLHAQAKSVKEFIQGGHYFNVIGFGIDHFIGRDFSFDWADLVDHDEIEDRLKEILSELIDDGHIFDENELDKMYAWLQISPHYAMSITTPIRNELQHTVRMFWASCVVRSSTFADETNDVGFTMMKGTVIEWAKKVTIPHAGIGTRHLLE
tara:strand:+ start:656 stop:1261 length:606 start_codon:yes stop_codon:yes gene_type:complete